MKIRSSESSSGTSDRTSAFCVAGMFQPPKNSSCGPSLLCSIVLVCACYQYHVMLLSRHDLVVKMFNVLERHTGKL
ncbi:hypothetical protein CROQUDRAFT_110894 [Cronartium quercuum f. sp. fusiforme G11]|uniref:Uncharacterized protein n=1 Tax=Cronartium quercuum f. sp. fusiforme G11 TaxID=708437 RepID=A0A9P6T6U2_9BASI|nr:hypothetical protein CROQUDRAFT_110894 [Cronartium quercuum f. sp. fusiforme G11]